MARKNSLMIPDMAGLPTFPLVKSEIVRFVPPREPIRADLTLAQDIALFLQGAALSYAPLTIANYGSDLRAFERVISSRYGRRILSSEVNEDAVYYYLGTLHSRQVAGG